VEGPIISIIDDDASLRTAIVRLLKAMGFSADAFTSAEEYLASRRLSEARCLIADVEMPGISGIQLQERLIVLGHDTPMIFITAFPEEQVRERAMNAGAVDFLAKPVDETQLLGCIQKALTRRRHVPPGT
jgi:FixJ family two-component response regulator